MPLRNPFKKNSPQQTDVRINGEEIGRSEQMQELLAKAGKEAAFREDVENRYRRNRASPSSLEREEAIRHEQQVKTLPAAIDKLQAERDAEINRIEGNYESLTSEIDQEKKREGETYRQLSEDLKARYETEQDRLFKGYLSNLDDLETRRENAEQTRSRELEATINRSHVGLEALTKMLAASRRYLGIDFEDIPNMGLKAGGDSE